MVSARFRRSDSNFTKFKAKCNLAKHERGDANLQYGAFGGGQGDREG